MLMYAPLFNGDVTFLSKYKKNTLWTINISILEFYFACSILQPHLKAVNTNVSLKVFPVDCITAKYVTVKLCIDDYVSKKLVSY